MNGLNEIEAINSWASSEACRRLLESVKAHGTPYPDERAGQPFTLDGNVKVYRDGTRVPLGK